MNQQAEQYPQCPANRTAGHSEAFEPFQRPESRFRNSNASELQPQGYQIPEFDRIPPHSIEAERCLLASLALNPSIMPDARMFIKQDSFYQADHQIIFDAICHLIDHGKPVDMVLIREELSKRQQLEEIGGLPYLVQILNSVPSAAHGMHYAEVVRDKSLLRKTISACNETLKACYSPTEERAEEIVLRGIEAIGKVSRDTVGSRAPIHISGAVHEEYERLQSPKNESVLVYGIKPMDDALGSPELGEMVIIGARPSMGKSTLARTIALSAAAAGVPVALISLEENQSKVSRNFISAIAQIENHVLRKRTIREGEWKTVANGVDRIAKLPIYFTDKARTIQQVKSSMAILNAKHGVKMFLIDYLQRIGGTNERTEYERTSRVSFELSDTTKMLDVSSIVLSQLSRPDKGKTDHTPRMDDLRSSGQIEQDADVILLLNREDYWHTSERDYTPTGILDLHIAKFRDGERGYPIKLRSQLQYQRFIEPEEAIP